MKALLGICVGILLLVFVPRFMPVEVWAISVHEVGHAWAAWLTGGNVIKLSVERYQGLATTSGGFFPFISLAGYWFTAFTGSLLILSLYKEWAKYFFSGVMFFVLATLLIKTSWMSISFWIAVLGCVGSIFIYKLKNPQFIVGMLLTLLFYTQYQDLKMLLFYDPYATDAGILARYLSMEFLTYPIAMIISAGILYIWYVFFKAYVKTVRLQTQPQVLKN